MDLFFTNPNNEIQKHIDDFNLKYLKLLTLIFGLVEVGYFILSFNAYFDCTEQLQYRLLFGINAFVCLFFYFSANLFYYRNDKKALWVEKIQAIIIITVTICTILLSSLDFRYGGDSIFYCSIVLAITTLTLQSPFQAALYHFISGTFFLIFFFNYKGTIDYGYLFKFSGFILLCFASGVAKYKLFVDRTKAQLELINLSENFRQSSLKDTLTGAKNRRALIQDSSLFCKEHCFFLFTDIDHFKNVNDSYGHQNGDLVITYYARKLSEIFGDEHVYRFGGDEFMVVYPSMDKDVADNSLVLLKNALNNVIFDKESHSFSVSGGYLFTILGCDNLTIKFEDILRKLDHALYEVKNNGRGYFLQA